GTCTLEADGSIEIRVVGAVRNTATAKVVSRMERTFRLEGDHLVYVMGMEAVGEQMSNHLQAELTRST
nr:FABP family protein [Actinomycetales bacterium]